MPKRKKLSASSEPIDLTSDTPVKIAKVSDASEDDDLIITKVVPPPAVVITSYTPAERSTPQTVLGLMADIMGKVRSHNSRYSPPAGNSSNHPLKPIPKKPNNSPSKITVKDDDTAPPTALRCAICLSSFSPSIQLSATVCGHIFCQDCIDAALKQGKKVCPICRKDLKGKAAVHRLYI